MKQGIAPLIDTPKQAGVIVPEQFACSLAKLAVHDDCIDIACIHVFKQDLGPVVAVAGFARAAATGAWTGMEDATQIDDVVRWDKLDTYARYAAEGRLTIPIARTFALKDWREALGIGPSGKFVLRIGHGIGN